MVRAVPELPDAAGGDARRAHPPARARPLLRQVPPRRADGRGRRLPRGPTRERGAHPRPGGGRDGCRWARGTSSWTSSSSRARRSCGTCRWGCCAGAAFGGAMEVGYLPDMFGHIAQMPQILRLAGFEHAVVWRGVPSVIDKSAFVWEAPDGSSVRAEYLVTGYGNGASIPDDAKALVRRIADHEKRSASFLLDGHAVHERHRPPRAPAVARAGRGRGQRDPGRLRARDHDARPTTWRARPPTGCRRGRASCARGRGPTSSWAWRRTAST